MVVVKVLYRCFPITFKFHELLSPTLLCICEFLEVCHAWTVKTMCCSVSNKLWSTKFTRSFDKPAVNFCHYCSFDPLPIFDSQVHLEHRNCVYIFLRYGIPHFLAEWVHLVEGRILSFGWYALLL